MFFTQQRTHIHDNSKKRSTQGLPLHSGGHEEDLMHRRKLTTARGGGGGGEKIGKRCPKEEKAEEK